MTSNTISIAAAMLWVYSVNVNEFCHTCLLLRLKLLKITQNHNFIESIK